MSSIKIHTLEVHTLHIRDFGGERLIQALGNFRDFEISTACVESEARALLYPGRRIFVKSLPFVALIIIGIILVLTLSVKSEIPALKALGFMAIFVGLSGIISEVRKNLATRKTFQAMTPDERLKYSTWQCVLKIAPKKYNDNDLTYIPVDDDTKKLSVKELGEKYNLLPAIADKASKLLRGEETLNDS